MTISTGTWVKSPLMESTAVDATMTVRGQSPMTATVPEEQADRSGRIDGSATIDGTAGSAVTGLDARRVALLSATSAMGFVLLMGLVSLFADMTYEGGRSLSGQYLRLLGSSAAWVGIAAGAGEFLGYGLRFISGYIADRTGRYR